MSFSPFFLFVNSHFFKGICHVCHAQGKAPIPTSIVFSVIIIIAPIYVGFIECMP
jgi:hypothetical protein